MRNESTLRINDEKKSDIVSKFIEENFYKLKTKNFSRITNKEQQIQGIDVIFDFNDENYVCDEKSAVSYINKPLFTFAFELSFLDRSGNLHLGWLLNDKNVNNSYLICWINKAKTDNLTEVSDIQEVEIALIKKEKIIQYLVEIGWNKDKLIKKSKRILINNSEPLGNLNINKCRFHYSQQLVEKPVNVLINRNVIISISEYSEIIKKSQ